MHAYRAGSTQPSIAATCAHGPCANRQACSGFQSLSIAVQRPWQHRSPYMPPWHSMPHTRSCLLLIHTTYRLCLLDSLFISAGDINTLLTAFEQDHQLQIMVVRNTSVSGKLDAGCATTSSDSILRRLLWLQIDMSPVTGAVPYSVMSSANTLSLKHTNVSGPLHPFPTSSPLRVLELVQVCGHSRPLENFQHRYVFMYFKPGS